MLVNPPPTLAGRLGAVLSALIVIFSLIGLTLNRDFYAGMRRKDYWAYYTNQSNLLVLIYFALIAPALYTTDSALSLISHAEFALMLCIMLTHLVYHRLLAPFAPAQTDYLPHDAYTPIARADSCLQHYVVPLLTFAYWLLCSPDKAQLGPADAAMWLAFPLGYTAYVLIRARFFGVIYGTKSAYPYPFLNLDALGAGRVVALCSMLLSLCLLGALAVVLAVRCAVWLILLA